MTAAQKKNFKRAQKRQEKRTAEGWVNKIKMSFFDVPWNNKHWRLFLLWRQLVGNFWRQWATLFPVTLIFTIKQLSSFWRLFLDFSTCSHFSYTNKLHVHVFVYLRGKWRHCKWQWDHGRTPKDGLGVNGLSNLFFLLLFVWVQFTK